MKLVIAIVIFGARFAAAGQVRHVPPPDAEAGTAIELVAEAPPTTEALVAHVRTTGERQFRAIELVRRDDAHWVAVVPATTVVMPSVEYYLDAGGQTVFASAEWPYTLPVHLAADNERRARDDVRTQNRRSRVHTSGEWVDYGTRTVDGVRLPDNYYRIDADFAYQLLAYPLEELRVGYTRLLGTTQTETCPTAAPCTSDAGFKVGGWFELGLAPIEGIRFDARAIVMATAAGFAVGGRGEARLGDKNGSHVALGAEYLADVGSDAYFRLGWGTVPKTPMAATVEVTNLPASTRDTGVRLFYDIARDVGGGVRLGVRIGYAARNADVAGITGGAGATVDF